MPGSFPEELDGASAIQGDQIMDLGPDCFMPPAPESPGELTPPASPVVGSRRSSAASALLKIASMTPLPSDTPNVDAKHGKACAKPEPTAASDDDDDQLAECMRLTFAGIDGTSLRTIDAKTGKFLPGFGESSAQGAAREAAENAFRALTPPVEPSDATAKPCQQLPEGNKSNTEENKRKPEPALKVLNDLYAKYPMLSGIWPEDAEKVLPAGPRLGPDEPRRASGVNDGYEAKPATETDPYVNLLPAPVRLRRTGYIPPNRWDCYPRAEEDEVKLRALHSLPVPLKDLGPGFDPSIDPSEWEEKRWKHHEMPMVTQEEFDSDMVSFWRFFGGTNVDKLDAIRYTLEKKASEVPVSEEDRYTDEIGRRLDRFTKTTAKIAEHDYDALITRVLDAKTHTELLISDAGKARVELCEQERSKRLKAESQARAAYLTQERLKQTGGLRLPCLSVVQTIPERWVERCQDTMRCDKNKILAITRDGTELKRHDFARLVPYNEWLNDEIINATLEWIDDAVNKMAGVEDPKKQPRKCLALSSFFFKRISDDPKGTDRTLRRYGVDKSNFNQIDTVLIPICEFSHWTLLVLRPSKREFSHIDSLKPKGTPRYAAVAHQWMHEFLKEEHKYTYWTQKNYSHPAQVNGYDCGMHVITNAICLALGVNPIDAYLASDMPMMRLRIACVLLNIGFHGLFALDGI